MTKNFFLVFLIALSISVQAETLSGVVVGLADGDTLTVLDADRQQHKIRLSGIDAPEKAQPFGDRSKLHLSNLTFQKNVQVEWHKMDRYGRIVGKVIVDGVDVNLEQVKAGMAWWYRDYAKEQSKEDRSLYEHHELMAKLHRTGLWNDKNPTPPWDWRKIGRNALK